MNVSMNMAQRDRELEQLVAERTKELEAANRALRAEVKVRSLIERRLRQNRERLRSLAGQLEEVEERERRRIAGNLHDLIGQTLVSANMKLAVLAHSLPDPAHRSELEEVRRLNEQMLEETRDIITAISPPVLEEQDMRTAAAWLIDHFDSTHGLEITYTDGLPDTEVPEPLKRLVFRSLQELLLNVVKHAQTQAVSVRLGGAESHLELEVADGGLGFESGELEYSPGFGLFALRERVEAFGGSLEIDAAKGRGSRVAMVLPWDPA